MLLRTVRAGICAGYFDSICLVQPAERAADGVYILRSGEGVDPVLKGEAEVLLSTSSIQVTIYRQGQRRAMGACGGMPYRRRQRASNPTGHGMFAVEWRAQLVPVKLRFQRKAPRAKVAEVRIRANAQNSCGALFGRICVKPLGFAVRETRPACQQRPGSV
jgi:hypothetical protein